MPRPHSPSNRYSWIRRVGRRLAWAAALAGAAVMAAAASAAADAPTAPPPVTILTSTGRTAPGDIFITPTGDTTSYANGAEILDRRGNIVWFHAAPQGLTAADFRAQTYLGRPVLTFWQGTGLGGLSSGTDYIYNDRYQQIATVNAGNGLSADGHEFLITPWNTALILSYTTATANLTSIGGPADQTVINGVVQEIDIRTGKVLFQWNSEDHVPFSQSEQPLPASPSTPWDWFHVNAVHLDADGNLLIDARDTWTTYNVNRFTGNIIWQLGGKDSSFKLRAAPGQSLDNAGEIFAWQHDPELIGPRRVHVLRQRVGGYAGVPGQPSGDGEARSAVAHRDPHRLRRPARGARGAVAGERPDDRPTATCSSAGERCPTSRSSTPSGRLVFNAEFPTGVNTYRAYVLPWHPGSFGR